MGVVICGVRGMWWLQGVGIVICGFIGCGSCGVWGLIGG